MDQPITSEEKAKLKEQYSQVSPKDKKPKGIKWPFKNWGKVKAAEKKPDQINVIYLNQKLGIEILQTKIYGGNFLVIREKVYRFAASKVWRYKNFSFCVAKEWDRELVGREDYEEVVSQGSVRSPLNDPVLIKALIQAKLAEKKQAQMSWIIWVILGIIGAAAAYFIFAGGGGAGGAQPNTEVATAP
jgi:hypothetical protein